MCQASKISSLRIEERLAKIGAAFLALYLFVRFSAMSFSIILPLLGAATVSPHLVETKVFGLIGVAVAFHLFAYVLNDVIDLPLDRTEQLRDLSPLVRGAIQPGTALAFALLQIPLALFLTRQLEGNGWAFATLGASFGLMSIYNLWGKRFVFPLLTDVVQGVGWGTLALYGVAIVPGSPTRLTGLLFAFVVIFIMMINGVHGSLRDLKNDLNYGVRSTAILLGARPQGSDRLLIPNRLVIYTFILQALLIGLIMLPLVQNWFGYGIPAWRSATALNVLLAVLSSLFLIAATRSSGKEWDMIFAGMLHMVILLSSLLALFVFALDRPMLVVIMLVFLGPLLTNSWLYSALWQWLGRMTRFKEQ